MQGFCDDFNSDAIRVGENYLLTTFGALSTTATTTCRCLRSLLLILFFLTGVSSSNADVLITLEESGSDVTATLSGSINTWAGSTQTNALVGSSNRMRPQNDGGSQAFFAATNPSFSSPVDSWYYTASTIPTNLGTNSTNFAATSSTASTLLFVRAAETNPIYIAKSYVLGTPITGVLTWAGQSFQTMGLTQGSSYVWSWGNPSSPGNGDSITLTVVPEPTALCAATVAAFTLGGVVMLRRRRRA